MTSLDLDIRRPCWCRDKKAMFHCWTQVGEIIPPSFIGSSGKDVIKIKGIVEFVDGTVELVEPDEIIFADGGRFDEYMFRYDVD